MRADNNNYPSILLTAQTAPPALTNANGAMVAGQYRLYLQQGGSLKLVDYQNNVFDVTSQGGGGGGGGGGSATGADAPPASPSPYDDEFSGTSLNPKWSIYSQTAGVVGTARFVNVLNDAAIISQITPGNDRIFGIFQPKPVGAFTMTGKITQEWDEANYNGGGLILRNSTNGNSVYLLALNVNGRSFFFHRVTEGGGNSGLILEVNVAARFDATTYYKVVYDGANTLTFYISRTGSYFGNPLRVENVSDFLGSNFDQVGINYHPQSAPNAIVVDWFRVTQP